MSARKTGKCITRQWTFTEEQTYRNPARYGRQSDPSLGEFDKDKYMDMAGHIEEQKEMNGKTETGEIGDDVVLGVVREGRE